jgi:hypothetical protein
MNRIHRILLPAAALLLAAAPARAQSDVTGPIPTGSGIAGMGYPVVPVRDIEGALFRQVNGRSAFRTRAVADAVLGEAASAYQESCSGTLKRPRDWADSVVILPDTQRVLCGVLGRDSLDARRMLHVLRGGLAGHPGDAAERLVTALVGLAHDQPSFVDERQRFIAGTRWEEAFRAYDRYLDTAPDALLDPPSTLLVAIGALLDRLVDAGMTASER